MHLSNVTVNHCNCSLTSSSAVGLVFFSPRGAYVTVYSL